MHQFEHNPQSAVDARESDTPFLAAPILAVILRLFHRSRLIFLTKMLSYVSYMIKNTYKWTKIPWTLKNANSYFHLYGYYYSTNWGSHVPRTFFLHTSIDLATVSWLKWVDILCLENVKLELHYWTWHRICVTLNFCSFNYFEQCSKI